MSTAPSTWTPVGIIQHRLRGGEKFLGIPFRSLNEALWPRMAFNPSRGPADLNLLGVNYFAEQKADGPGFTLTRVGL
jgi:hypothetical protein